MDEIDLRKIIERSISVLKGDPFEDFCDHLCLVLYPNDYTSVRAGGVHGDDKNDGYCPKARIFFQVHGTINETNSDTKDKIKKDLDGCIKKHRDVKSWIYLTNIQLVGTIETFIDELRPNYPSVSIETWDHQKIADKIVGLSKETISSLLDLKLPRADIDDLLDNVKKLVEGKKDETFKEIASSKKQNQIKDIGTGYSGGRVQSLKGKSDDYKKVITLYMRKPTKEITTEIKKIVYSSDDPEAILQATLALASLYEYSRDSVEDQNTLLDIGIETAISMKAPDAEAILIAEKGMNISTQFCILDLEGWGKVEMANRSGWPIITPQEQSEIVKKLNAFDLEFKKLFKIAIDKAMESRNYLVISRVFCMIGSAAGARALHFINTRVKGRAEAEKKVCKSSFMYAKSILINAKDNDELALLMHNFANAIRGFGETEEALDLIDKAIKIAKKNKVKNFMDKAKLLRDRILNPLPNY